MRRVVLNGTEIETTALGFGCAGLMRPTSAAGHRSILDAVYESGVRHFDIARYYGHGGAERVLGDFIKAKGCRSQVTITTKLGIEPTWTGQGSVMRWGHGLARRVASIHPTIRRVLVGAANRGVKSGQFSPESVLSSLETSLQELQTDYVDVLLLHEATRHDAETDGLLSLLEKLKHQGKIRTFGVGTQVPHALEISDHLPSMARIVQFANSVLSAAPSALIENGTLGTITHGALKPWKSLSLMLVEFSRELQTLAERAGLGSDSYANTLSNLLLGFAIWANRKGIVLFASSNLQHVEANSRIAHNVLLDDATWEEFQNIIAAKSGIACAN